MMDKEEKTADLYDGLWDDLRDDDFFKYRSRLRKILPESLYRRKECLDAGCGQGAVSSIISEKADKLCSVDIGRKAVKITGKRISHPEKVVLMRASLLKLPFPDSSFDFVVSNGVVHHTDDPAKALSELKRVLKPEGTLMLGLYGKTGLLRHAIEMTSMLLKWVPYRIVKKVLLMLGFSPLMRYYILDYIYVPIRKRFSIKEIKSMMEEFSDFKVMSDYPSGKLGKIVYGTNYFYISAKKQQSSNKVYK